MGRYKQVCRQGPHGGVLQRAKFPPIMKEVQVQAPTLPTEPEEYFTGDRVQCGHCGLKITKKNLIRHTREVHGPEGMEVCMMPGCTFRTKRAADLLRHQQRRHPSLTEAELKRAKEEAGSASMVRRVKESRGVNTPLPAERSAATGGMIGPHSAAGGPASASVEDTPLSAELAPVQKSGEGAELALPVGPHSADEVISLPPDTENVTREAEMGANEADGEPSKPSRFADVRRQQERLNKPTRGEGEDMVDPQLEAAMEKCLMKPGGLDLVKSVLRKRKLVLLTPEELRMEKLQARRRGREYAQRMTNQAPRLEALKSQLSCEVEPRKVGVVEAMETGYYELPSYFNVGGKLLALSVRVDEVEVIPSAKLATGDSAVPSINPQSTCQVDSAPTESTMAEESQVVPSTLTPTLSECHLENPFQGEADLEAAVVQAAKEVEQRPVTKSKVKRRNKKPITPEFVDVTFSSDSD